MTWRTVLADFLLGEEKQKLAEAANIFVDAYLQGPLVVTPDEIIGRLSEMDSHYLDLIARRMQYDTAFSAGFYVPKEEDRMRLVDLSRRMYDNDPITQAIIDTWTDFAFGLNVEITPRDEAARLIWDAFWQATINSYILSTDNIHNLSVDVLKDGDLLMIFFISTIDGSVTIRTIPTQELKGGAKGDGIVTLPDDNKVILYYRREYPATDGTTPRAVYYRDWRATDGQIERFRATQGNNFPPSGEVIADEERQAFIDENTRKTKVVAMLVAPRPFSRRGKPLLSAGMDWSIAYRDFMQDRLAVSKAVATYVDKLKVKGGSRAIDMVRSRLESTLNSSGGGVERNPPPPSGSTWLENDAIERSRFSLQTGAVDAEKDGASLLAMAGIAGRMYAHWLGRGESFRLATASAMETPTLRAFNRYQLFWSAIFGNMVKIVLKAAEDFGGMRFSTYDADFSTDAILTPDMQAINELLKTIQSLVTDGLIDLPTGTELVQTLVELSMQNIGIKEASEIFPDIQQEAKVNIIKVGFGENAIFVEDGRDDLRAGIKSAVRGYWAGHLDYLGFLDTMILTTERNFRRAWNEGAASCGVTEMDLTEPEQVELQNQINNSVAHISDFADRIQKGSKANGGKLETFMRQIEKWVARYDQVVTVAKVMACADRPQEWVADLTKDNCPSCLKLNGKVKRASFWKSKGILPRQANANYLECGGWECGCQLLDTGKPISRGPLPSLP